MPRTARLDAPGVLHHVMIRGIERRNIFRNNKDREDLIARLEILCPNTHTKCYAWTMVPNHAHFIFRTETEPWSRLMRRLLTALESVTHDYFKYDSRAFLWLNPQNSTPISLPSIFFTIASLCTNEPSGSSKLNFKISLSPT